MRKLIAKRVKNFFFLSGTQASWEAGFEGVEMPGKPGYRKIEFHDGDLYFEQIYNVTEGFLPHFSSNRTISFQGEPVWKMECRGRYNEDVMEFLRRSLMKNYLNGVFIGGRGPGHFLHPDYPDYAYENITFSNKFGDFLGHDKVHFYMGSHNGDGRSVSEIFCFCNYRGGFLPGK